MFLFIKFFYFLRISFLFATLQLEIDTIYELFSDSIQNIKSRHSFSFIQCHFVEGYTVKKTVLDIFARSRLFHIFGNTFTNFVFPPQNKKHLKASKLSFLKIQSIKSYIFRTPLWIKPFIHAIVIKSSFIFTSEAQFTLFSLFLLQFNQVCFFFSFQT